MRFEIRCECGWQSQGDLTDFERLDGCPDCGQEGAFHTRTLGVPYSYPPYSTWSKHDKQAKAHVNAMGGQRRRVTWKPEDDPYAKPAFWLGGGALLLSLVGCGALPAVVLAIFALQNASSSRRFCTDRRIPRPAQAGMGSFFGVVSLLIVAASLFNVFVDWGQTRHASCVEHHSIETGDDIQYHVKPAPPAEDNADAITGAEPVCVPTPVPEPQEAEADPVAPHDDFTAWQREYSTRIQTERTEAE